MRTVKQQFVGMAAIVAVLLSLTGCGGGGGDDSPANRPPTANAGPDQTVDAGRVVMLVGSGSASDGEVASYQWAQTAGTPAALSTADQASASFIAPDVNSAMTLTFRLTVMDGGGATASDEVSVTVQPQTPANQSPSVNAGPDQTVAVGSVVMLMGSGSDLDGDIVSYQWTQTDEPTVSLSVADQALTSFVAPEVNVVMTLTFRLTVTDSGGATASDEVSVTVQPQADGLGEPFVLDMSRLGDPDFRLQ